jgi:hypothetical protein
MPAPPGSPSAYYATQTVAMGGGYRYATANGSLVRSIDGGVTWAPIGDPDVNSLLGVEPLQGREVILLRGSSIVRSTDGGDTGAVIPGPTLGAHFGTVDWIARRIHVVGSDGGIASKSIAGGTSWTSSTLGASPVALVAAAGGKAIATTSPYGLWHSPDGGATWVPAVFDTTAGPIRIPGDRVFPDAPECRIRGAMVRRRVRPIRGVPEQRRRRDVGNRWRDSYGVRSDEPTQSLAVEGVRRRRSY